MPRQRTIERDQAFAIFIEHNGQIANREIAKRLDIPEKTVGGWKVKDDWNRKLKGSEQSAKVTKSKSKRRKKTIGSQEKPKPSGKPDTHGFFRRIFPEDEELKGLIEVIETFEPLDILWQNIQIQYVAIVRAQRINYVRDNEDHSEFVVTESSASSASGDSQMQAKMVQPAWDKHANFLKAQSRAVAELRSSIKDFLALSDDSDERRLKIANMQADLELKNAQLHKLAGGDGEDTLDDGFMDALKGAAGRMWSDVDEGVDGTADSNGDDGE